MRRIAVLLTAILLLVCASTAHASTRSPPVLRVNADRTISFALVEGVRSYVFVDKVPGQADLYYNITCSTDPCTTDPRDWPGLTVRYGARTNVTNSTWATEVSITYPQEFTDADRRVAPMLTVNPDNTISWNRVADVTTYKFVEKVPGQADRYTSVPCCSFDPPDWSGLTVRYGIRTEIEGSAWASEVSIAYAGGTEGGLEVGMTGTPDWLSMMTTAGNAVHPKSVRLDTSRMSTTAAQDAAVANVRAFGARPEFLYVSRSTSPATIRAAAERYGPNATSMLPMLYVELGNEDSYSYKGATSTIARQYGDQVEAVANALIGTGVRVLPQMDEALIDSTTHWVREVYSTFPNMHNNAGVGGWEIHPYGPNYRTRINNLIAQATAQGAPASFPIMITEYGLSSDNGRCLTENYGWNRCMTYAEAGTTIRNVYNDIATNLSAVKLLTIYHEVDGATTGTTTEREAYFGIVRREGGSKAGYTNVIAELIG